MPPRRLVGRDRIAKLFICMFYKCSLSLSSGLLWRAVLAVYNYSYAQAMVAVFLQVKLATACLYRSGVSSPGSFAFILFQREIAYGEFKEVKVLLYPTSQRCAFN